MLKKFGQSMLQKVFPTVKSLTIPPRAMFSNSPFNNNNNNRFDNKINPAFQNVIQQQKAGHYVARNVGLNKFITRVYNTTGLSIMGALGSAYLGMSIPALMVNPMATSLVSGLVMLGSFIGMQYMKTNTIVENVPGVQGGILKTQNPISRLALFSLGVASLGISASPLFLYTQALSPTIIPSALGITLGLFGGASVMAYMMPKDKMLSYGRMFTGSLIGLIAMNLVGLGASYFMGPNAFSSLLFQAENYLGILLFSGLIAYDTHVAIKNYEMGNADHLGMAVQLLLDFWNLLIRIMSIMSRFRE